MASFALNQIISSSRSQKNAQTIQHKRWFVHSRTMKHKFFLSILLFVINILNYCFFSFITFDANLRLKLTKFKNSLGFSEKNQNSTKISLYHKPSPENRWSFDFWTGNLVHVSDPMDCQWSSNSENLVWFASKMCIAEHFSKYLILIAVKGGNYEFFLIYSLPNLDVPISLEGSEGQFHVIYYRKDPISSAPSNSPASTNRIR